MCTFLLVYVNSLWHGRHAVHGEVSYGPGTTPGNEPPLCSFLTDPKTTGNLRPQLGLDRNKECFQWALSSFAVLGQGMSSLPFFLYFRCPLAVFVTCRPAPSLCQLCDNLVCYCKRLPTPALEEHRAFHKKKTTDQ